MKSTQFEVVSKSYTSSSICLGDALSLTLRHPETQFKMTSPEAKPPPLPRKFKNIQEVRGTNPGSLVSLIGFAKDFQPAIATSRKGMPRAPSHCGGSTTKNSLDWKSSLELVDPSVQYEEQGPCIKLHFFAALDRQLEDIGPSDLVVLRDVKVSICQIPP